MFARVPVEVDVRATVLDASIPSWLPNESAFSLASRHHLLSGHRLASETCIELFGDSRLGSQHDLPTRLGHLADRADGLLGSGDDIAINRTLLRFYLPLHSPNRQASFAAGLAGGPVGVLKFQLGSLTSRFRSNHPLKACAVCMVEDRTENGTAYWHLNHQFPGVWMCLRHAVPLIECQAKTNGVKRFAWMSPETAPLLKAPSVNRPAASALMALAEIVEGWASLPAGTYLTFERLAETYRRAASPASENQGANARRMDEMARSLARHVAPLRVNQELRGLPASPSEAERQIQRWVFRPRGGTHPLRHLAMINWLFPSWPEFTNAYAATAVQRAELCEVEAPCAVLGIGLLAEAKAHFLSALSAGKSCTAAAGVAGVAVATGIAWAASEGIEVPRRPKSLKGDRFASIVRALEAGEEKAKVSKEFGISVVSVTRVLRSVVGLRLKWRRAQAERRREAAQRAWIAAIDEAGGRGIKFARQLAPAAYAWLYRNERPWLTAKSPESMPRSNGRVARVDWYSRDATLAAAVLEAAAVRKRIHPGYSLTVGALCQALPELKAKWGALERLPSTNEAINLVVRKARNRRFDP